VPSLPTRLPDDPSPRKIRADQLQGLAMIATLGFGLWQGAVALSSPAGQRQFDGKLGFEAVIAGRTSGAVKSASAHDLPTDTLWRTLGGVIRWSLFHAGGPQVWPGSDGWLYLTDELRPWPEAEAHETARADVVRRVADRLQQAGIGLLVTIVPDKARIEAATLGDAPRAAQTAPRYAAFVRMLRDRGIKVVGLAGPLAAANRAGAVYFRTDTHWNQAGAAIAARAVAGAAVAQNGPIAPATSFHTTADAALTDGPGDLVRLMSLASIGDSWAPLLRPAPDHQHVEHTVADDADDGGLLDDAPAIPVTLIGSSFSLNSNFAGRLEEALHAKVANVARLGGGFAGSAQAYFDGAAFRETPPKLIIWEIPERVLGQPEDDADRRLAVWSQSTGSAPGDHPAATESR